MEFELKKYKFEPAKHNDKNVIWVRFPNDANLRNQLKQRFPSVRFSWSNKCWHLNDAMAIREQLGYKH